MKVGDSVDDIIKSYYRDQNYQNHLYVSEDKTLTYGKFCMENLPQMNWKRLIQRIQLLMVLSIIMDITALRQRKAIMWNLHILMGNTKAVRQQLMMILRH